jgi:thiol-disulfide isomerase/thioredoxin
MGLPSNVARNLLAVTAAVALVACGRSAPSNAGAGPTCSTAGTPANLGFTLRDLNGTDVALASFKGKVVFLNFWATWCGPCKAEIPVLVDLHRQYQPQGFEVVGIVVDDDFALARPFTSQHKMIYPVLDGTERRDLEAVYKPVPLPKSFLIARDGSICAEHIGIPRPRDNESLADGIRRVLEAEIKPLL